MIRHSNKNLIKNKIKKNINQTYLVPITFGALISKERNYKKIESKTKRQKNACVKILMDSVVSSLIIHVSYVNKNILLRDNTPRINGPQWLDFFYIM